RSVNGFNQIHLVALFNLLSQRYLDAQIQPIRKKNEFLALSNLIDRFDPPPGTSPIFIADRGFHSYNVFAHAIEKGAYFLIRAKDVNTKRLLGNDFPDTDSFDVTVNRILTRTQSKKKHRHPLLED
ncbi:transposase, partial [Diplocloster modestus]